MHFPEQLKVFPVELRLFNSLRPYAYRGILRLLNQVHFSAGQFALFHQGIGKLDIQGGFFKKMINRGIELDITPFEKKQRKSVVLLKVVD